MDGCIEPGIRELGNQVKLAPPQVASQTAHTKSSDDVVDGDRPTNIEDSVDISFDINVSGKSRTPRAP